MSKELEALDRLIAVGDESGYWNPDDYMVDVNTVKQALIKAQEQEKVIRLIFEKMVNILLLELAENVDEYNERIVRNGQLTEEEFNLLKRYF